MIRIDRFILELLLIATLFPLHLAEGEDSKQPVLKIGSILILSGLGAEQGINSQRGAILAQEEINSAGGINGKRLEILFEDEMGPNPKQTLTAYHKLTQLDGIKYILGPQWQNELLAVQPVATKEGVFLITPSTCGPNLTNNVFCLWADPEQEMDIYAKYIYGKHKSVVAFGSTESWETICLKRFISSYEKLGGKVLLELWPNQEATDVKTEALRTKAAKPDAIFSSSAMHFAQYRKELSRLKVDIPFYTVELFQELINAAGPTAEGVVSITPTLPDDNFKTKFVTRFKAEPDVPSTQAYDAVNMLAQALRQNGDDVQGVKRYFREFKEYPGAIGKIRSDDTGKTLVPVAIYQVRNGKQVLVLNTEEVAKLR